MCSVVSYRLEDMVVGAAEALIVADMLTINHHFLEDSFGITARVNKRESRWIYRIEHSPFTAFLSQIIIHHLRLLSRRQHIIRRQVVYGSTSIIFITDTKIISDTIYDIVLKSHGLGGPLSGYAILSSSAEC